MIEQARALNRPIAINLSQGMNGGGHAGETTLETGLDNLLREPGVAIIKSSGNEQEWRIHAGGQLMQGQTVALELAIDDNDLNDDIIEIWADGRDQISVAVQPPGGPPLAFVTPGTRIKLTTETGNRVTIDSRFDADGTGDTQATVFLARGLAPFIQPGTWKLLLRGDEINVGRYDAWIERTNRSLFGDQSRFTVASADHTRTISIPGTARRVIVVGAYVTRPTTMSLPVGQVSSFSSRGPTRYGVQKPDLVAPGELIVAPRSQHSDAPHNPDQWYTHMTGTSMAAPHVAAVAAMILRSRPDLTCEQVKQILMRTAQRVGLAAVAPDNAWGSGKLNAASAYQTAQTLRFPQFADVSIEGSTLAFRTDPPTTSAVRFHTNRRHLQLGKNVSSRSNLTATQAHAFSLADLPAGIYYCEIIAYTADNWWTADDNGGVFYEVEVP